MPSHRHKVKTTTANDTALVESPNSPDLILLRNAAIEEREAIALYLEAAENTPLSDLFLEAAEDENEHYIEIMRQVSRLDPVQAKDFREQGLNMLTYSRPCAIKNKWACDTEEEDSPISPTENDLETIQYLTRALTGELEAVNMYQLSMNKAHSAPVKDLFCHLMNEEKHHVAQFTAAIFDLTHLPASD